MTAYYNEFDPKAAAWLRELIKAGLIAPGDVDERSIVDVNPYELTRYTQHHFFAGIGGWSYALRLAGWPDDRAVVTASCPCQPFSAAGKQLGTKDERHLWPVFRDILTHLGTPIAFGEQVASKAGRDWLAGVRADLEGVGYAVGAADLCAASASPEITGWIWIPDEIEPRGGSWIPVSSGPPHIRQRIYWVANAELPKRGPKRERHEFNRNDARRDETTGGARTRREVCGLADGNGERFSRRTEHDSEQIGPELEASRRDDSLRCSDACGLEHTTSDGREQRWTESGWRSTGRGCWDVFDVVHCTDGKARRFEPGSFPLAHGVPNRVGLLRGYGNAIVPELAAQFIQAATELT